MRQEICFKKLYPEQSLLREAIVEELIKFAKKNDYLIASKKDSDKSCIYVSSFNNELINELEEFMQRIHYSLTFDDKNKAIIML